MVKIYIFIISKFVMLNDSEIERIKLVQRVVVLRRVFITGVLRLFLKFVFHSAEPFGYLREIVFEVLALTDEINLLDLVVVMNVDDCNLVVAAHEVSSFRSYLLLNLWNQDFEDLVLGTRFLLLAVLTIAESFHSYDLTDVSLGCGFEIRLMPHQVGLDLVEEFFWVQNLAFFRSRRSEIVQELAITSENLGVSIDNSGHLSSRINFQVRILLVLSLEYVHIFVLVIDATIMKGCTNCACFTQKLVSINRHCIR